MAITDFVDARVDGETDLELIDDVLAELGVDTLGPETLLGSIGIETLEQLAVFASTEVVGAGEVTADGTALVDKKHRPEHDAGNEANRRTSFVHLAERHPDWSLLSLFRTASIL